LPDGTDHRASATSASRITTSSSSISPDSAKPKRA
jgi:hypothetical protein